MMTTTTQLPFEAYRSLIRLDKPFKADDPRTEAENDTDIIIDELLTFLKSELPYPSFPVDGVRDRRRAIQALLTMRRPDPLPDRLHAKLDRLLQKELQKKKITDAQSLPRIRQVFAQTVPPAVGHCSLWQGDITTLKADAIVNAANSTLLGCFTPFHGCIDNVIHAAAGPRLREDCHAIMVAQGHPEDTGRAKITRGYNLPSRHVLHTVGPIFESSDNGPSQKQKEQLAACYVSCLDLASRAGRIQSIAFCAISTGVFAFPPVTAARIALDTVARWLERNPGRMDLVVFNVFSDLDRQIYEKLLLRKEP